MLKITIEEGELYDEESNTFSPIKPHELQLEHSLVSLSKWESKWQKPFLTKLEKTQEETIDYIRCMTITQNVDPKVYYLISADTYKLIDRYIDSPMTATTFAKDDKRVINRDVITAEVIYYWMIATNVPFECQKWHLNRLLTLINVCNTKNQPAKRTNRKDVLARNRALNAQRRAALGTKG